MARVYQAPPIPGVKDFLTLVEFLKNPEAYEDHLNDLLALREDLAELVEKVGKAEEIDTLLGQATEQKAAAEQYLAQAQAEAKDLVATAERQAAERLAAVQRLEADVDGRRADLETDQANFLRECARAQGELDARAALVAEREAQAAQAHTEAESVKAIYEAKLNKLKAVTEDV